MRVVDNLTEFIQNVKTGTACLWICIPNITRFLDDSTKNLKEEGHYSSEITKITWKDIRGICPVCCMWTERKFMGASLLISHIGRDNVAMRGYGAFFEELLILPVELLSEAERRDCDSIGVSFVE